jgi:hypothetical protein
LTIQNLHPAAVRHDHSQIGRGRLLGNGELFRQRQSLERRDLSVAFGNPFGTNPFGYAFDLFGADAEFGQIQQRGAGLGERAVRRAGVGDFLLDGRTGISLIDAQSFGLREKKPADSGDSSLRVPTIRLRRPWFARGVGWRRRS